MIQVFEEEKLEGEKKNKCYPKFRKLTKSHKGEVLEN